MPKEFRYTVVGRWPFPLDMLRHDQSAAATPQDQELVDRLSADFLSSEVPDGRVSIRLVGPSKPNTARWESFGWSVPGDTEHQMAKRLRQEAREREALRNSGLAKLTPSERKALDLKAA